MDQSRYRMKKRGDTPTCPFCQEKVVRPAAVDLPGIQGIPLDFKGGRCSCGALFILDATGRQGGQILIDGLAALCDGDLDRALVLKTGVDYKFSSVGYSQRMHTVVPHVRGRSFGQSKLWFFKLLSP